MGILVRIKIDETLLFTNQWTIVKWFWVLSLKDKHDQTLVTMSQCRGWASFIIFCLKQADLTVIQMWHIWNYTQKLDVNDKYWIDIFTQPE